MTYISFYGGISTIGGNCIIIEEDEKRIMLDNGMCFSKENKFYKDFLSPRSTNDLRDYFELDLIPKIPGIYGKEKIQDLCACNIDESNKYLYECGILSYEEYLEEYGEPYLSALFLTHAHLDHVRNIKFLAPEIPIYCSEITKKLLEIICDLSDYKFLEYSYYEQKELGKRSLTPGEIKKKKFYEKRNIITISSEEIVNVDNEDKVFQVKGYSVDHSIPGAMAYEISTKQNKRLVYTGDLRFHGHIHEKECSLNFIDNIAPKPDVLINEGTRIDDNEFMSEDDVIKNMTNSVSDDLELSNKLIIASFPWKSISRFLTTYEVAKNLKRDLVIQPKLAYTIHHLQQFEELKTDGLLEKQNIKIYLPRKNSMLYSDADYSRQKYYISPNVNWTIGEEIEKYAHFYGEDILVKSFEIRINPGRYFLHLNFYELNELIDIQPPKGSYFFNLKTEPFDEEGELEEKVLRNWLSRFELEYKNEYFHASGHASGKEIKDMIKQMNPKQVYPIHTEKPELFNFTNAIKDVKIGKKYSV
ncbi:MAG: MBL fold metallo-hydrolase [Candidatus Lokiarchaeota archaeon]|nr:MBL fold metallo-hydrolase [Candidatus Lokiarchaeota archaeon]MBD3201046.1 MBL fold metallo-hydrolase [Candidatus Lokiarchaeota archaeon]